TLNNGCHWQQIRLLKSNPHGGWVLLNHIFGYAGKVRQTSSHLGSTAYPTATKNIGGGQFSTRRGRGWRMERALAGFGLRHGQQQHPDDFFADFFPWVQRTHARHLLYYQAPNSMAVRDCAGA